MKRLEIAYKDESTVATHESQVKLLWIMDLVTI